MNASTTMEGLPLPQAILISVESIAWERAFGKVESGQTARYLLTLWVQRGDWTPLSVQIIGEHYIRHDVGFQVLDYGGFIQPTETGYYAPTRAFVERCIASVSALGA